MSWPRVTFILELLQHKKKLKRPQMLVPALFSLLSRYSHIYLYIVKCFNCLQCHRFFKYTPLEMSYFDKSSELKNLILFIIINVAVLFNESVPHNVMCVLVEQICI